jgi:hypothetical protein
MRRQPRCSNRPDRALALLMSLFRSGLDRLSGYGTKP